MDPAYILPRVSPAVKGGSGCKDGTYAEGDTPLLLSNSLPAFTIYTPQHATGTTSSRPSGKRANGITIEID